MSVFFYHLYRKISREEYKRILSLVEKEASAVDDGETGETRSSTEL